MAMVIFCLLSACEFMSYQEYALPEYDGDLVWEEVSTNADWKNRWDHAAVAFDGKMWIAGGYNSGEMKADTYYEDVWSSVDGINWNEAVNDAPWKGRRGHQLVSFKEKLMLVGGFAVDEKTGYRTFCNDVWQSSDGQNWEELKPSSEIWNDSLMALDWYPRMNHACAVVNQNGTEYLYLFGGFTTQDSINGRYGPKYFNDVWRTEDGAFWERVMNNDYGFRAEQAFCVDPNNGTIYMQGGSHGVVFSAPFGEEHPIEDFQWLWQSEDGVNWTSQMDTSINQGIFWRIDHQMVHYKGSVWGLPGKSNSPNHYHFSEPDNYPIWRLDENGTLKIDSEGVAFDARHGYASVVFKDKIWVLGGFTNRQGQANDVWCGTINE